MRHVTLTCKNHPELRWSCKEIAFTPGKGYNGVRHIFFNGWFNPRDGEYCGECDCSPAELVYSPEEIELQKTEPLAG